MVDEALMDAAKQVGFIDLTGLRITPRLGTAAVFSDEAAYYGGLQVETIATEVAAPRREIVLLSRPTE